MSLSPRTPEGAIVALVFGAMFAWQGRSVLLMLDINVSMTLWVWVMLTFLALLSLFLTVAPPIAEKGTDGRTAGD